MALVIFFVFGCGGESPLVERRLVRFTIEHIVNSVDVLSADAAQVIRAAEDIPGPAFRSFPPLADEGNVIGDAAVGQVDRIGNTAGLTIRDAFILRAALACALVGVATISLAQVDAQSSSGGSLLDRTVIPFVTEASHCGHVLDGLPALVFGGHALGVTVAQAFLGENPLGPLAGEAFVKEGVAPIAGLWTPPV